MFDTINLDGLTLDPDTLEQVADTLSKLSVYAKLKAKAIRARRAGHVQTALTQERKADAVYVVLPDWAKW